MFVWVTNKKAEQKKTGGGPAPPHYTPAEELALGLNVNRPIVEGMGAALPSTKSQGPVAATPSLLENEF